MHWRIPFPFSANSSRDKKPRKRKEKWKRIWSCPPKSNRNMAAWETGHSETRLWRRDISFLVKSIEFIFLSLQLIALSPNYIWNMFWWHFFPFQNHLRIFNGHFFFKEKIIDFLTTSRSYHASWLNKSCAFM